MVRHLWSLWPTSRSTALRYSSYQMMSSRFPSLPYGSQSVTSFYSIQSMTFPKSTSKCPFLYSHVSPLLHLLSPFSPFNSSYCLLAVEGAQKCGFVQSKYLLQGSEHDTQGWQEVTQQLPSAFVSYVCQIHSCAPMIHQKI